MILTSAQRFRMLLVPYHGRNASYDGTLYGWKDGKLFEVDKMYIRYREEHGESDLYLRPYIVSDEEIATNEECIFVIDWNNPVVAMPEDMLGDPIKEVYKIIATPELIGMKRVLEYFGDNHVSYTFTPLKASHIQKIVEEGECYLMTEDFWETGMEKTCHDIVFVDRKIVVR